MNHIHRFPLLLSLLLLVTSAQSSSAFYNPQTGRWLSRDPIGEKGGKGLYSLVANGTVNRTDYLGLRMAPPGGPADPCKDPCGTAKRLGLDDGALGGVVCCRGIKYVCTWGIERESKNSAAQAIIAACNIVHESTHLDDIKCPSVCSWGFVTRPPFQKGKKSKTEECQAYQAELLCLSGKRKDCGGDPACLKDVDDRIEFVKEQIGKTCGTIGL